MFELFNPQNIHLTKYLFFTGKGGVGKTSVACATAMFFADRGKNVLLISTDPASNLQDVFHADISDKATAIDGVPNLKVLNIDPIRAAAEYRESVIAPYRGKLPESVIENMAEQLSGSCTVEIAAFNEFSNYITDDATQKEFDAIIFDTAPTGHTLRMLQLPSAWTGFLDENKYGTSCLGQLSGLESQREVYRKAVKTLADGSMTTLILVSRPEDTPLTEAQRASFELWELGVHNQILVMNGVLTSFDDSISKRLYQKQHKSISLMPLDLRRITTYQVPLRAYNILGLKNIRKFLVSDDTGKSDEIIKTSKMPKLSDVIDDLYRSRKRVIFTMGKGGVGKTTVAAAIALGLVQKGVRVHLTTTDPAEHLKYVVSENQGMTVSHIDEKEELKKYSDEVLAKARQTMGEEDLEYVREDLRSPCTQEIAVFRAFAEIVDKAEDEVVVIDTAPTGHTLLLLDTTQNYHRQLKRAQGDIPESVLKLLPRLRNESETEVVIVTLAEATPVFEAMRLEEDLKRAGILAKWWVINSSLYVTQSSNRLLMAKASNEIEWINKVFDHSGGHFAIIGWSPEEIKGEKLKDLLY
jgi:arsenite-transporting ATPase